MRIVDALGFRVNVEPVDGATVAFSSEGASNAGNLYRRLTQCGVRIDHIGDKYYVAFDAFAQSHDPKIRALVDSFSLYTRDEKTLVANLSAPVQQGLLKHPLMVALRNTKLSAEQIKNFCDVRYNAASEFLPLLKHTLAKAKGANKPKLAEALEKNLRDETGYDRDTGEKLSTPDAHSDWRKTFLDALGVTTTESNHFPLYQFKQDADLPTLVGLMLAAETVIPREDDRILRSVCKAFPDKFIDYRDREAVAAFSARHDEEALKQAIENSRYLVDHIEHDPKRHLYDLVKAIFAEFTPEERTAALISATELYKERKGLYDHIAEEISLTKDVLLRGMKIPVTFGRKSFIISDPSAQLRESFVKGGINIGDLPGKHKFTVSKDETPRPQQGKALMEALKKAFPEIDIPSPANPAPQTTAARYRTESPRGR
jgi:pyrroloquinoline quinone (PQQ) biosynthesis protein C